MARSKSPPAPVQVPAPDPFPSTLELAPQRFRVSLYSSPTKVIEAKSPEEAWELYKPLVGLIASAHTPEIVPDGDDCSN